MPLDPRRVKELFVVALELPDVQARKGFLDRECAADTELRQRLDVLLAAHDAPHPAVNQPLVAEAPGATAAYESLTAPAEAVGSVIAGKYKLLQEIGEGGMGSVFMADQTHPVKRRVAVKVIKAGMDSARVLARFEAERQALALMDHPNIAKVLDAGTTETGRPFFVMELVKGIPLTQFCDEHKLPVLDRLNLFMQVCSAVQHAHQKGIIHRDLKPTNILVESHDGKPVPKAIDFGLAKATSGMQLTEHTLFTALGQVAGTPLYMAPEQAAFNAIDVDTRADVYALGVILYELLTGTTPIERETFKKAAFDEMLRVIREQEPPTPSSRISSSESKASVAALRQMEPVKLGRFVRGELDWIVMKSLSKERDRRYESATAFAKDVQRFLNHEPVQAGPPSAAYKLRKFVRRNRPQVIAVAVVLLALIAGMAGTIFGLIRADHALAAEAKQRAIAEASAKSEAEQRTIAEQREREATAAAEREAAARTRAEQERDRADKAAATAQATQTFLLTDTLGALAPEHTRGKQITVDQVLAQAAAKAGQAFGEQPEAEAAVRATIGSTYKGLGLFEAADSQLTSALEIRRRVLGDEHRATLYSMFQLGDLRMAQRRLPEAEVLQRRALETQQRVLGAEHPDTLLTVGALAFALREQNRLAEAEPLYRQNLAIRRRLLGPEHPATLREMQHLAIVLQRKGQLAEAEPIARAVLEAHSRVVGPDSPRTLWFMDTLGMILHDQKKLTEAEPLYRQTLETSRRVLGDEHPDTLSFIWRLSSLLLDLDQRAEAESLSSVALDTARRVLGPEDLRTELLRGQMLRLVNAKGDLKEAEELLRESLAVSRKKLPPDDPQLASSLAQLGKTLVDQNKAADAEPLLRECLTIREKQLPDDWVLFNTKSMLGGALAGQKKFHEAEPLLVEGYSGMKARAAQIPPAAQPRLPEAIRRLVDLYTVWEKPEEAEKWKAELEEMNATADKKL